MSLVGSPTILVVDDEALMREVTGLMIEENGGTPLFAVDGEDAVAVFQRKGSEIDAIFLDFSMPKLNGYQVYQKIRAESDSVGFVMASGLAITPEVSELVDSGEVVFLPKPFREAELIGSLNSLAGDPGA